MDHPTIWQKLLAAEPPVDTNSEFQKMFRTPLNRRVINHHRNQQRTQRREAQNQIVYRFLEGSPLRDFFLDNTADSELRRNLLLTLAPEGERVFTKRFLEGQSAKSIADGERISMAVSIDRYLAAREKLEATIKLPEQQWSISPSRRLFAGITDNSDQPLITSHFDIIFDTYFLTNNSPFTRFVDSPINVTEPALVLTV